jgi:HEPN domain-containing protein/predicted nucleotidyltransferase
MRTSLSHIPQHKQQELQAIVQHICQHASAEMVILFGSYARGDWVEEYAPDGIHFEYQSDFDLLVIVETRSSTEQSRLEQKLEDSIEILPDINTPVSTIVHDIEYVNSRITRTEYFFADIKKEGILLYDSGKFKLEKIRKLSPRNRYNLAKEDYEYWFEKANDMLAIFQFTLKSQKYNEAAFILHQVAERLYNAVLLVFTRYKPKTHNLQMLRKLVNALDSRFITVFPLANEKDRYRFELLRKAYVDARYNKNYMISLEELSWLAERVKELQHLTEVLCQEKINSFL